MTVHNLLVAWLSLDFSRYTVPSFSSLKEGNCSLLLKLNHAVALQNRAPVKTQSAGKSELHKDLRKQFSLVYLSFPLHVATKATENLLKEMKSLWRIYKFSAFISIIWLFCFSFFLPFVFLSPILEHVLLCAWLVSLISPVLLCILSLLGSLWKKFLWGQ